MLRPPSFWRVLMAPMGLLMLAACNPSSPTAGDRGPDSAAAKAATAPLAPSIAAANPATTAAAAATQPPVQAPITLVLTWMTADQPPQTTQMAFRDLASCERARDEAIAESRRLASEAQTTARGAAGPPAERHYVGNTLISGAPPPPPTVVPMPPPRVAAICAGG